MITEHDNVASLRSLSTVILEEHLPSKYDPVSGREVHISYQPRCTGCIQSQWPCAKVRLALAVMVLTTDEDTLDDNPPPSEGCWSQDVDDVLKAITYTVGPKHGDIDPLGLAQFLAVKP